MLLLTCQQQFINKIEIYLTFLQIFCHIMNPSPGLLIDTEYEALKHFMYILKQFKDKIKDKGCH